MPSMAFECYTIDQAAAVANISPRTLKRRLANRSGPAVTKIGRRVVVRSDMLQAWLVRCTAAEAGDDREVLPVRLNGTNGWSSP